MGLSLLLFVELFCTPVALVVQAHPWVELDSKNMWRAVNVCYNRYGPRSPCLKSFIKAQERTYHAICGREE